METEYFNREEWQADTLEADALVGLTKYTDNFRDTQRHRANIRWARYREEKARREAERAEYEERAAVMESERLEALRLDGGAGLRCIGPYRVREAVIERVKELLAVSRVGVAELERAGVDQRSGELEENYLTEQREISWGAGDE